MAPRLALELILHTVEASLQADGLDGKQAHFQQLRLVNKAVKAQAHRSYPNGLSLLANKVVQQLLLERTTPSTFAATLKLAKPVLGESSWLNLVYQNRDAEGDDPVWCSCAARILGEARRLEGLFLYCQRARLNLRQLNLERFSSIETLEIRRGWRDQLCPLDLSGMVSFRSFSMETREHSDALQPFGLRLPRHLVTLDLSGIGLTSQDVLDLDFPSFSELQELTIDDERLTAGSATALQLRRLPRLRRLTLYGPWVGAALKEIRPCEAMEKLDLSYNYLASVAGLQLAGNSTITSLNLSSTKLSDPSELGLTSNRSLVTLNVSGNPFSSYLFGLDRNTTLRSFNVGGVRRAAVPPAHVRQLSTQLARNTILESLGLSGSLLDNTAGRELRLERTTGLKELDLSQNDKLRDEGVIPLLESIEQYGLKVCVDLSGTQVSEEVLERFRSAAA